MNNLPIFEFAYDDKWFNIYEEGRVEVQEIAPSLKGSRVVINRLPILIVKELSNVTLENPTVR